MMNEKETKVVNIEDKREVLSDIKGNITTREKESRYCTDIRRKEKILFKDIILI